MFARYLFVAALVLTHGSFENHAAAQDADHAPEIMLADSINGEGKIKLVRYSTVHIGMTGYFKTDRTLHEYSLKGVDIFTISGKTVSVDEARKILEQATEHPIVVTAHRYKLSSRYEGLFQTDSLLFIFPGDGPFSKLKRAKRLRKDASDKITQAMVEKTVTSRPGVFRFVICRASNLVGLAIERRDVGMNEDAVELLKSKFKDAATEHLKKETAEAEVSAIAEKMAPELQKLVDEMEVTARWHEDGGSTSVAYLIAEIDRPSLKAVLKKHTSDLADTLKLDESALAALDLAVTSNFSVGWAGNDYYFTIDGFVDPLKRD